VREKINMEKNGMKVIVTIRPAMACRTLGFSPSSGTTQLAWGIYRDRENLSIIIWFFYLFAICSEII
jgi:hypothetical protein